MIKIVIALITLLFSFSIVFAGDVDTDYIQQYSRNKLILSLLSSGRDLSLTIKKEGSTSVDINYLPNTKQHTGIGVSFLGLGGAVSWTGGDTQQDEAIYGKTKYIDYQLSYYGRKIGIDANFQQYSNFYLDKPDQFDASWQTTDPYPQRTDLHIRYYGLNTYYIFSSEKFSFKAAFNQTERQKKKAGSFLLMGSVSYLDIKSDRSLIPASKEADFGDLSGFKGGNFLVIGLSPGYAYSFIFSKFYITPSIFVGPSFQQKRYDVATGDKTSESGGFKSNIRLAGGYNSDTFFAGITAVSDITSVKQGEITVESNTTIAKLFMGYKF
ncbi:MAG: DUF4421 family protein [bacterium]